MPVEIRELIITGTVVSDGDQAGGSTQALSEEDIKALKEDIISTVNSEGVSLAPEPRKQLMDDLLREVRKMTGDRWRR